MSCCHQRSTRPQEQGEVTCGMSFDRQEWFDGVSIVGLISASGQTCLPCDHCLLYGLALHLGIRLWTHAAHLRLAPIGTCACAVLC